METLLAIVIGCLVGVGVFLMLRRSIIKMVLGLFVLSHAANLVILIVGRLRLDAAPIIRPGADGQVVSDPLVQALVLTAIVISFGLVAFLLVLVSQTHREAGSDDVDDLRDLRG